jgi:hypothetical protein
MNERFCPSPNLCHFGASWYQAVQLECEQAVGELTLALAEARSTADLQLQGVAAAQRQMGSAVAAVASQLDALKQARTADAMEVGARARGGGALGGGGDGGGNVVRPGRTCAGADGGYGATTGRRTESGMPAPPCAGRGGAGCAGAGG